MKCPKCLFENREGALFCLKCGEALAFKCRACGHILPMMANFCDRCGMSQKNKEEIKNICGNNGLRLTAMSLKEALNNFEKKLSGKDVREIWMEYLPNCQSNRH